MKITSTQGYPTQQNYHSKLTAIKIFHNKQKLKQYVNTKPPPQKILQGILHTENEANKTTRGWEASNDRRRQAIRE
jgi:hypothetical protein